MRAKVVREWVVLVRFAGIPVNLAMGVFLVLSVFVLRV